MKKKITRSITLNVVEMRVYNAEERREEIVHQTFITLKDLERYKKEHFVIDVVEREPITAKYSMSLEDFLVHATLES